MRQQGSVQTTSSAARGLSPLELANARATLEHVYAGVFADEQKFESDSTSAWFTTTLDQLIKADRAAGAAQCGVGFLNFNPLTSANDDVKSYALGDPRSHGDTALVPVVIHNDYPPPAGTDEAMTIAMLREAERWRIANIVQKDQDLVLDLRKSVAELRAVPPADCSTPAAEPSDSVRRDATTRAPS